MAKTPLHWFGGKANMLGRLRPLVPRGGVPYCEPYAGGAALFFARDPAPVEVLNDLDGELVGFYRTLQNPEHFARLNHMIQYTLYARAELERAIKILQSEERDPVMRAWALMVSHRMGFGGKRAKTVGNWGRSFTTSNGRADTVSRWNGVQADLARFHERIIRAQIDCVDALQCIRYWDNRDAVFYVDPPYHSATRIDKAAYAVEADDDHHRALVETLLACKGAVTLSGYAHPVYEPLERAGWMRKDFATVCHAAGRVRGSKLRGSGAAMKHAARVETVWINPRAMEMLEAEDDRSQNQNRGKARHT